MDTQNIMDNIKSIGSRYKEADGIFNKVNVGNTERIVSAVAGAGLLVAGLIKPNPLKIALAVAGGFLLYRGASGNCPVNTLIDRNTAEDSNRELTIKETVTVNKPKDEVYNFWRRLENLPIFMTHLDKVEEKDGKRSFWVAKVPGNIININWEAEITSEEQGVRLAWKSLPGANIENSGEVLFKNTSYGDGTEITATISYKPPVGDIGHTISKLFNSTFEKMIKEDIKGFKRYIETGEVPTDAWMSANKKKDNKKVSIH